MTAKPRISKAQAIRDYLQEHPTAAGVTIRAELKKKGFDVKAAQITNIRVKLGLGIRSQGLPIARGATANTNNKAVITLRAARTLLDCLSLQESIELLKEIETLKHERISATDQNGSEAVQK